MDISGLVNKLKDANGGEPPVAIYISKYLLAESITIHGIVVSPCDIGAHVVWGPWVSRGPMGQWGHGNEWGPKSRYEGPWAAWYRDIAAILDEVDAAGLAARKAAG